MAVISPDSCSNKLQQEGKPYPRTCLRCGLGPCHWLMADQPKPATEIASPTARVPSPYLIDLELCILRGNEEFVLAQISDEDMQRLDSERRGTPTVFAFCKGKIRVWPIPAASQEVFHVRLGEQGRRLGI